MTKKKDWAKVKPAPTKLSEFKTPDAHLKLKISKEIDTNSDTMKNYIVLNEQLIEKLGVSYKNLFLEMNTVSLRGNIRHI
jgi:hypothetical protein